MKETKKVYTQLEMEIQYFQADVITASINLVDSKVNNDALKGNWDFFD